MSRNLVILTGYDGFFGQTRKPWISMDTARICELLSSKGILVKTYEFSQVVNAPVDIQDSFVFYSFSQRENLRRYIYDVLSDLDKAKNTIIPSLDLLHCHENKGYQLLFAKRMGFSDLWSAYCSSKRELKHLKISYPVVLKTIDGSNGRGVFLISNAQELQKQIIKLEPKPGLYTKWDILRRKTFRKNETFNGYPKLSGSQNIAAYEDYIVPEIPFILQEFVPGLACDYRVIILGKRYYAIKRMVRDKDFRASGAKRFVFDPTVEPEMFDYAKEIYQRLNTPFLSLDIGKHDSGYCLFEYQALHFGINAIIKSDGFWQFEAGTWKLVKEKIAIEESIADALAEYLSALEMSLGL